MKTLSGKTVYQHLINSDCENLNFGVEVIHNGSFTVTENLNLSKNHTFRVRYNLANTRYSLFIKQPKKDTKMSIEAIENEYNFFKLAHLIHYNSDLIDFDKENTILLLLSNPNFISLTTNIYKTYDGYVGFASSASKILFDFHEKFKLKNIRKLSIKTFAYLSAYKPEFLEVRKRWKITAEMWSFEDFKTREIAHKIEQAELFFDSVSSSWKKSETVIHRDLKYSNFIINDTNSNEFQLIDYELAAIGDRCWDVSEFIFQLLRKQSSPDNIEEDPEWILSMLYDFSDLLVSNYYIHLNVQKESFYKKILSFFIIRLIQSYVSSVLSNLWDDKKKDMEYNNIIFRNYILIDANFVIN